MSVQTITLCRGLPGSGKTTWAKAQGWGVWRVSRDDFRAMFSEPWPHGDDVMENLITQLQRAAVVTLLSAGHSVIIDDTHLQLEHMMPWIELANSWSTPIAVHLQEFLHVPIDECIARDAARPHPVGEAVIRDMWRRYLGGEK